MSPFLAFLISNLTGIPRATVIRKLKKLIKNKHLIMDNKKLYDSYIQQGLNDIKDIQTEYKKVYGWYSNDYNELKRFLLE